MATDVKPIFELGKKLRGLMDWAVQSNIDTLKSIRAVARATGIKRSTLNSNLEKERLSSANQEALAEHFGFRVDWLEWRDPEATRTTKDQRRDCAEAFLKRFAAHQTTGARLSIEASMTENHIDRRFADFRLAVGSFEPSSAESGIPLVLSVSFDPRGWPVFVFPDLTVWLTEVDLQLIPKCHGGSIKTVEFGCYDKDEGNFCGKVFGLSQWWRINVVDDSKKLAGTRFRNNGADCVCQGFHAGDEIKVIMTARVSDCFVTVDGTPLDDDNENKKRFKEHLLKLAALRSAEAILAEQKLTLVEKL